MPRFAVQHSYTARRDGQTFGPWVAGDEADLQPVDAEWVERDSPGTLVALDLVDEQPPADVLTPEVEAEAHAMHEAWLATQQPPAKPARKRTSRGAAS